MQLQLLINALKKNQIHLPTEASEKLVRYLDLIQTWNKVFNLTTILEPKEMVYLHLIDSLTVLPYLKGQRALDVGSGAGLPGIPLAIAEPSRQWVLLDKNNKKTLFLTQVIAELGLKNVEVVHGRCEDFHPAQCFDTILSRAYGTLRLFAESCEHLLCQDGMLLAMKGKYPQEELAEIPSHFTRLEVTRLAIHGVDIERHLVCLSKKKE